MAVPATTGIIRTSLEAMQIGDYISCRYEALLTKVGSFSNLGSSTDPEILADTVSTPKGTFYLIKVAKGVLISDRVIQADISTQELSISGLHDGVMWADGIRIRMPSGGVAYRNASGNIGLTDANLGSWPVNNDWDRYVLGFPLERIQEGKTALDVFNISDTTCTLTCDTPHLNLGPSTSRVQRGTYIYSGKRYGVNEKSMLFNASTGADRVIGFRPVFEYEEVN